MPNAAARPWRGAVRWHERRFAPAPGTPLCRLAEIPDNAGREFVFGGGRAPFRLVVVRRGAAAWAYLNLCPHFWLPLNAQADRFVTRAGDRIMCHMHYALFRFEDGACLDGPCVDRPLEAIPIELHDGMLRVAAPA
jgi:nitrite reductase/ring-hydroxylating ferredoxin subunit